VSDRGAGAASTAVAGVPDEEVMPARYAEGSGFTEPGPRSHPTG
jgi:hypothetical protein